MVVPVPTTGRPVMITGADHTPPDAIDVPQFIRQILSDALTTYDASSGWLTMSARLNGCSGSGSSI